ncbi:sugar transferase [Sutcliffiella horikoshii]|uniref:sugar transferase n=1 Tax=Sutcliffiella horikoshii TaxID=79883 RepID=UPI001CC0C692|nr:sugar transferase [Sutcliffiella horikoshii]UAL46936.1 sugar transferase [Sutcliffiella horikoshii]
MKRTLDIILSILVLSLFSPLFIVVSILIWFNMGSPILYKQKRPGLNGKPFILYKFRTMTNFTDKHGRYLSDETRLTSFGSFLRRYSLDEIPQFINVLTGELSLVGPRPLLMEYLPLYSKEQFKRHLVKPGITGWAQVNGRNAISWEEKFDLDVWYVYNYSFFLDLKILLLTVIKVIKKEGISQPGYATIQPFSKEESRAGGGHG